MTRAPCAIDGCDRPHKARGWCVVHYERWRRHGDPTAGQGTTEYILGKVDVRASDECWPFASSAINRSGHVMVWRRGRMVLAHRLVYELQVGPIPDGMVVMHRCDNPPCANWVRHLVLGTVAENNLDRDGKGRHVALPGSRNGNAKLSEWQVREIRRRCREGDTQRAVADDYEISQGLVSLIVRRKAWRHVLDATALDTIRPRPQRQEL